MRVSVRRIGLKVRWVGKGGIVTIILLAIVGTMKSLMTAFCISETKWVKRGLARHLVVRL